MANISAHGRTKVETLKNEFKAAYGVGIRVYNGVKFADENATLASVRPDGKTSEGSIKINGKMLVGNVEKKFFDVLGVKVQIEDLQGNLADNGATLTSLSGKLNDAVTTADAPAKKPNKTALVVAVIVVGIVAGVLLLRAKGVL